MENENLITEILLRLPKRSLARFKAVSKHWLQNISSTCFKQKYASRNKCLFGFFYYKKTSPEIQFWGVDSKHQGCSEKITIAPNVSRKNLHMKLSCNGLILCEAWTTFSTSFKFIAYVVYNPITAQFFPLPPPPNKPLSDRAGLGLAFDHSSNPPLLVVTQVFDNGLGGVQVESFSSYTLGWSSKSHNLSERIYPTDSEAPFFNGRLHWRCRGPNIFAYDVRKECFSFIPKPAEVANFSEFKSRLYQSRDRLVYIQLLRRSEFTLWTLEDYYLGNWALGYRISMQVPRDYSIVGINPDDDRILYFKLDNHDEDDDFVKYSDYSEEMYSYNLENGDARLLSQGWSTDAGNYALSYYSPYMMPTSPSSIPPQCYFSALFAEFPTLGRHGLEDLILSRDGLEDLILSGKESVD